MRLFRNHGITRDPKYFSLLPSDLRPQTSDFSWFYEMMHLGYNYRITDFQCALGISQLRKLPKFLERRRGVAARYDEAFAGLLGINPLAVRSDVFHAYHLYVIRINSNALGIDRTTLFTNLREKGIGVNVHYIPMHLHPFYREKFHTGAGLCPVAEAAYEQIISLLMFPGLSEERLAYIIEEIKK